MKKILFLFVLCISTANAIQAQVFNGGMSLGGSFTQIDGDATAGFDKIGMQIGFIGEIEFTERWFLDLEILYSQKGSKSALNLKKNPDFNFKINYDYIEIPVIAKFHDLKGGLTFGAGLSFGRLLRYKYTEQDIDLTDSFFNPVPKKLDIAALAQIDYMFNPVFGIGLRSTYSLTSIRPDCANSRYRKCATFNNAITLRAIFIFSALFNEDDV